MCWGGGGGVGVGGARVATTAAKSGSIESSNTWNSSAGAIVSICAAIATQRKRTTHASFAVLCSGSAVIGGSKKDRKVSSIWLPWIKIAALGGVSVRCDTPDFCARSIEWLELFKACRRSGDEKEGRREFQGQRRV